MLMPCDQVLLKPALRVLPHGPQALSISSGIKTARNERAPQVRRLCSYGLELYRPQPEPGRAVGVLSTPLLSRACVTGVEKLISWLQEQLLG